MLDCILDLLGAGDPEPRLSPDWSLLLTLPATILPMEGSEKEDIDSQIGGEYLFEVL